jgi:phosphatidylglycerol:prolipoprotein diacylglycerol transferase
VVFPPGSFAALEFGRQPIHPSQIYFALAGLLLFAITWCLRRRVAVPGTLFWTFIILFALIRIPLDFTRAYEPGALALSIGGVNVTESQVTSLALVLFGSLMLLRLRREALPGR